MNARLAPIQQKQFSSRRVVEQAKNRFGYQSTYIGLVGIVCFLLIYYVISRNTSATLSYNIIELERTQNELQVELERLNVTIAEMESLETITNDEQYKSMESASNPEYLVIQDGIQYVYNN